MGRIGRSQDEGNHTLLVTFTIDHIMFLSQPVFLFFNNRLFLPLETTSIQPTLDQLRFAARIPPTCPQPPLNLRHVAVYDGGRPRGGALPAQRGAADLGATQAWRGGQLDGQGLTTDGRPWGMRPAIGWHENPPLMI